MAELLRLISTYAREHNAPIELCYHPDADPGDGSGWAILVGDRHFYGDPVDALVKAGVLPVEAPPTDPPDVQAARTEINQPRAFGIAFMRTVPPERLHPENRRLLMLADVVAAYDAEHAARVAAEGERDAARKWVAALEDGWSNARDTILNGRHQLAEEGFGSERINAVLGVLDDNYPEAP